MRVPETKPVVTQTMGKKKHKLRKQSKDEKLCAAGSDSSDEAPPQGAAAGEEALWWVQEAPRQLRERSLFLRTEVCAEDMAALH